MKMTRESLKALIKECLLEILNEGLGGAASTSIPRSSIAGVSEARQRGGRLSPDFDPRLDTPVSPRRAPTAALKDAIKRNAGGNPIMESIFADTARTTLASQLAHGDMGSSPDGGTSVSSAPGISQQEQFAGTPEQVFGEESTSRWANLAFMDAPTKKTA